MTEDKFDDFLRKNAKSYNAPPVPAPREEMWQAIQATRRAGPRVVYGGGASVTASTNRFGSRVWWAAAAAVVLVAGGIGIGRWTVSPDAPSSTAASSQQAPADQASPSVLPPAAASDDPPTQVADGGTSPSRRGGTEKSAASAGNVSTATVAAGIRPSPGRAPSERASAKSAYQAVADNHLTRAEALLTSLRTRSTADQRMDAQLASWARELLSNTRLLLDSPVAADANRRPLLEDLELLLVQIVQLSPGSTPQDRELMEQTLKQDQILTKLRTAIPAGQRGS